MYRLHELGLIFILPFSGMPEDEDLRYVWAVAELERSVKESKTRRDVLQRVVGYQTEQIGGQCFSGFFLGNFGQISHFCHFSNPKLRRRKESHLQRVPAQDQGI